MACFNIFGFFAVFVILTGTISAHGGYQEPLSDGADWATTHMAGKLF